MYSFILLFNLFDSLTTDFTVTGSGTNSVQRATHNAWEIFRNLGYICIYDALQRNVNLKTQKYDFFEKK